MISDDKCFCVTPASQKQKASVVRRFKGLEEEKRLLVDSEGEITSLTNKRTNFPEV